MENNELGHIRDKKANLMKSFVDLGGNLNIKKMKALETV